jgi:hypothetical protein
MGRLQRITLATLAVATCAIGADGRGTAPEPDQVFGKVPLGFEENAGQTDPSVKYFARGNGYTAFLTQAGAVLQLTKKLPGHPANGLNDAGRAAEARGETISAMLRMNLVNENPKLTIAAQGPMPARITYLSGPGQGQVRPALFQKIEYRDVWPGVSMVFYGNQRQLEYDLIVAPGTLPSAIQLAFEGARDIHIDPATGELVVTTEIGDLRQPAPALYQEVAGKRVAVDGRYTVAGRQIAFQVGSYDTSRPLVIDPTLSFGVTWGGSGFDYAEAVAVDPGTGAIYVAGYTSSPNFPVTTSTWAGYSDMFVSKVSPDGTTLLFSTYVGGSFDDDARGIALDKSGNVFVTGQTQSADFPRVAFCGDLVACIPVPPSQIPSKFFVVKLSPSGSVLFSEPFGGSGQSYGNAIAIGDTGYIVVAGRTYSPDFPVVNSTARLRGQSDAFVTVLQLPTGYGPAQILYSTLIGGYGDESAKSVATVPVLGGPILPTDITLADILIGGWTGSADFPVTPGAAQLAYGGGDADGFVVRIQVRTQLRAGGNITSGSVVYATYFGGEGEDVVYGVAADSYGAGRLTGYTRSLYFPTTYGCFQRHYGGGYSDAFLAKLDGAGRLLYSTYFGGSGEDYGRAILAGYSIVYLAGYTDSPDLPLTRDAFQTGESGGWDTFAAIFFDDGATLAYSSYIGTWGDDFAYGAALDKQGDLVIAGSTNATQTGATNVLLLKFVWPEVHAF